MSTGILEGASGDPGGDECACRDTVCQDSASASKAAEAEPVDAQGVSEAGPVVAVKQYLRDTVVSHVEEAMLALVKTRPADPLQFLIDHLTNAKAQRDAGS
jgi:hypothetical protein